MGTYSYRRSYSLDVLKVIATCFILFHHFQQITGVRFGGINFYSGSFYFGWFVELFFILSGFFMYRYIDSIKKGIESFRSFIWRRLIRFLPYLTIATIAYQVLAICYRRMFHNTLFGDNCSLWGTIITALGIQDGWCFKNPGINNPTWYISVLLLCYVVFYIMTRISSKYLINEQYLFIAVIFAGVAIISYDIELPFLNSSSARGYYAFFTGLMLGIYVEKTNRLKTIQCFSAVIIMSYPIFANCFTQSFNDTRFILSFVYFPALVIVFDSKVMQGLFNHRMLGILANISFHTYIWHLPVLILLFLCNFYIVWNSHGVFAMGFYAVACFAVGTISYFGLERPIQKMANIVGEQA